MTDQAGTVSTFITKDSGKRAQFKSGAQRDGATGKGRYDLLPREAIHRLAQLYERGAEKYDDRNWEQGMPLSEMVDSMLRHAFQAAAGMDDEDHFAAVMWNAAGVITFQERIKAGLLPKELDDLPEPQSRIAERNRRLSEFMKGMGSVA